MLYRGDVLIAVGVALILITLCIGYVLYTNVEQANALQQKQQNTQSLNASVGYLSSGITNIVKTSAYYIVEVIILFLFASIGYKIASIGMEVNRDYVTQEKRQSKSQDQRYG